VYSLAVSVPGELKRLASDLFPELVAFERVRRDHSLLVKRFENGDRSLGGLRAILEPVMRGIEPFRVRTTGIECFERPVRGSSPVVYLAVESPGLDDLHHRLVEFDRPVADLEGSDYTPHVTLARGGASERAQDLVARDIEEIEWTVSELQLEGKDGSRATIRLASD
jgi:2'-5' RNA ligase